MKPPLRESFKSGEAQIAVGETFDERIGPGGRGDESLSQLPCPFGERSLRAPGPLAIRRRIRKACERIFESTIAFVEPVFQST